MELLDLQTAQVQEYDNNPRVNDHAVQDMATLIGIHGFRVPVLVRSVGDSLWELVDGHLRLKAAQLLGLTSVPAIDVSDMDDDQVSSFRISVNRAAELAEWDVSKLLEELNSIQLPEDDVSVHSLTGMDDAYISALADEPVTEQRSAPASEPQTREQSADPSRVRSADDTVSLNISMTVAQRTEAIRRLDEIKAEQGMSTRSEAFLHTIGQSQRPTPRARTRTRGRNPNG